MAAAQWYIRRGLKRHSRWGLAFYAPENGGSIFGAFCAFQNKLSDFFLKWRFQLGWHFFQAFFGFPRQKKMALLRGYPVGKLPRRKSNSGGSII
jgi:hypothetical protein